MYSNHFISICLSVQEDMITKCQLILPGWWIFFFPCAFSLNPPPPIFYNKQHHFYDLKQAKRFSTYKLCVRACQRWGRSNLLTKVEQELAVRVGCRYRKKCSEYLELAVTKTRGLAKKNSIGSAWRVTQIGIQYLGYCRRFGIIRTWGRTVPTFFFFFFFGPRLWHMEVPGPGIESEPQL